MIFSGVLMWELFTLGEMPYTGMESNEALFQKINDGYRLEKPEYSTTDIYDIMLSCWFKEAETRPLFNELEEQLKNLLEDYVQNVRYLQSERALIHIIRYLRRRIR